VKAEICAYFFGFFLGLFAYFARGGRLLSLSRRAALKLSAVDGQRCAIKAMSGYECVDVTYCDVGAGRGWSWL